MEFPLNLLRSTQPLTISALVGPLSFVVVYVSLWDASFATFRGHLSLCDITHSVMLDTMVSSKLYFDLNIYSSQAFINRCCCWGFPACRDNGRDSKARTCVNWGSLHEPFQVHWQDPWSWRNSLRKMQPLALEAIRLRSQSTHSYVSVSIIDTVSLTKKTYDRLIGVGVSELPKCFEELAGKQCLFQIRVTSYNFTPHYRTFTVSTKDVDVKTHSAAS